ncbi:RloB domain-containing protein [Corynebacterium sp. MNWGS58]|uniref:RloB domain-containing protein n=1 Tax=Corynebacterium sp. 102791.4 TaxID=3104612 RepID=UPI003514D3A5
MPRSTSPSLTVVAAGGEPRRVWDECRNRMDSGDFDFGCLVLDHDDHPTLPEVLREVSKHKNMAAVVTNPQFELWLLLHAQEQTAAITARDLRQKVRKHDLVSPKNDKELHQKFPFENFDQAYARAKNSKHYPGNTVAGSNPSSGIPWLIDLLRDHVG